jgi:hypothetical protein
MSRARVTVTSAVLLMLTAALAAQSQWYALYDEAVKHIQAGEFQQAETKLLQAKKEGPASGRSVLRYGSLRQPYFPDYYLGVVYVSTNRPQQALEAFASARQANIDARNNEFRLIGTFEGQAKTALANVRNAPGDVTKPTPPTPADNSAAVRAEALKDFDRLIGVARAQLEKRNFDGAEQSANNARALSDKQGLGAGQRADALIKEIAGSRQVGVVEDAINRKDLATARTAWAVLSATAPTLADPALKARIDRLEPAPPPPVTVTPTNPGVNTGASIAQFEKEMNSARAQFNQRNFDSAEQTASNAARLAIKLGLDAAYEQRAQAMVREIDTGRRTARVEAAIKNRDVAAARKELTALAAVYPNFDARPLTAQVDRIENEINATALQRNAMRAFFIGNYQESVTLVGQLERTGMLSPRTQFYRACSLAALAAASNDPSQDRRRADAKKYFAEAAKALDQFKEDLRYISPKVRQLLGL